ncbi:unnamed protein product [Orchesella dallaii]|uniref:Uncharacterized protein n=1 Tax=Orchesella dallaii TaxID=48710 RepID=A0ABP1PRA6_9HEXA
MSQNEASSGKVEESGISDDPRVHQPSCHYFQYKQVHSKGLRSEEEVKLRLKEDLLRRRGRTQPSVVTQVEKEVAEAMSESGIVHQYLKTKRELYDSYTPLMKSFCYCETAKISNIGQPIKVKVEEIMNAPERHFPVDEMRQPPQGCLPVDQIQGASQLPVTVEHMQGLYGEKTVREYRIKKEHFELGHQATLPDDSDDSPVAPQPKVTTAATSARHVYSQVQLYSLQQAGLDLSEDESEEEPEAAADVLPPSVVNNFKRDLVDTEKPGEEGKGCKNSNSYLNVNPHDELDYGDD